MMYPNGTIREYLFHTDLTIRSSVIEQTARWRAENRNKTNQHAEQLIPGKWIEINDGRVGEIMERHACTRAYQIIVEEGSLRVREPYWQMVLAVFVGRIVFSGFAVYAV